MKPGQSDDFFDDDEQTDDADEEIVDSDEENHSGSTATPITDDSEGSESPETASDTTSDGGATSGPGGGEMETAATTGESATVESLPYIFDRDGVKDGRDRVQFFLREEFQGLDRDVRRAAEEELGLDVPLTDVREAMVRAAAEQPERVISILREDGYRLRE